MATKYELKQAVAENYAAQFARTLCNTVYADKKAVSGQQILEVTPVRQINLFIMRLLYDKWQAETLKLKSPYFDYQNEEVANALRSFMNILSQHISVKRDTFEGLVKQAVLDTLQLAVSPEVFLKRELEALASPKVKAEAVRNLARYLSFNKVLLEEIYEFMEATRNPDMFVGEVIRHLLKALHDKSARLHAPEALMLQLCEVEPITLSQLADKVRGDDRESSTVYHPGAEINFFEMATEAVPQAGSFEETVEAEPEQTPLFPTEVEEEPEPVTVPAPATAAAPVVTATAAPIPSSEPTKTDAVKADAKPEAPQPEGKPEAKPEPKPEAKPAKAPYTVVNQQKSNDTASPAQPAREDRSSGVLGRLFKRKDEPDGKVITPISKGKPDISHSVIPAEKRTLADLARRDGVSLKDTLANNEEKPNPIQAQVLGKQTLKDSIGLHDQMRFVKDLFHGSNDQYQSALSELESAGTRHKAVDLIINNYAIQYDWDLEREPASSLLALIERKYATA